MSAQPDLPLPKPIDRRIARAIGQLDRARKLHRGQGAAVQALIAVRTAALRAEVKAARAANEKIAVSGYVRKKHVERQPAPPSLELVFA